MRHALQLMMMMAIRGSANPDISLNDLEQASGFNVVLTTKMTMRDSQELAEHLGGQCGVGEGRFYDLNGSVNLGVTQVVILNFGDVYGPLWHRSSWHQLKRRTAKIRLAPNPSVPLLRTPSFQGRGDALIIDDQRHQLVIL
jgi:hypothetical protein